MAGNPKRARQELLAVPRSASRSLLKSHIERNPDELLGKAILRWLGYYLKTVIAPRHPYQTYSASDESSGIYTFPDECCIALAADWGTGTRSAYKVRDRILAKNPNVTIHLGDVYYAGKPEEFAEYFLGPDDWPRGRGVATGTSLPTYALNGNHEMYSGGKGYFDAIRGLGQVASYFSLENKFWRIIAIDSGYYSKLFPFFELLPWWIRVHRATRDWLRNVVLSTGDRRPIILLSHHQWFSAFEAEYKRLGSGLGRDSRYLLWFWGHEHRFAAYGAHARTKNGPRVRARCIGHGGMPIEGIGQAPKRNRNLVLYDKRKAREVDGTAIGHCGFAVLTFEGPALVVSYEDEDGVLLLRERWSFADGEVTGEVVECNYDALELRQDPQRLVDQ